MLSSASHAVATFLQCFPYKFLTITVVVTTVLFGTMNAQSAVSNDYFGHLLRPIPDPIYGVTVDSVSNLEDIVVSLDDLAHMPTTRIVFDEYVAAKDYRKAVNEIRKVSYIMGEILDSFYMKEYSVEEFKQRVDEYLDEFGANVDIWEIGNEINGEWLGKNADVVEKMKAAYEKVKERQGRAALTLYYNEDCWSKRSNEMFTWTEANVPDHLKMGLDYVLVSYYEDGCNGLQPEWEPVFHRLAQMFPNSKIGFSEVGSANKNKKKEYIERYYSMKINHPNYIGGYFWWYYKQDMVPKNKRLWTVLNDTIKSAGDDYSDVSDDSDVGDDSDASGDSEASDDSDVGDASSGNFGTPTNFTATQAGRRIKLRWTDVDDETGYSIKWRKNSRQRWRRFSLPANETEFTQKRIKRGHNYQYRIRAKRPRAEGGNSSWSSIVIVTTQ